MGGFVFTFIEHALYLPQFAQCLSASMMTLKYASSVSSRIKVHNANRKLTDGFLSDLYWD